MPAGSIENRQHNFGPIVEAERDAAVAQPAADNELCVTDFVQAGVILGEKTNTGREQAANEGQTELAAMNMAAQDKVGSGFGIAVSEFRPVGQKDSAFSGRRDQRRHGLGNVGKPIVMQTDQ